MKLLFKWIPRLILSVIILFVVGGVVTYLINKTTELPSIKDAPWAIQTYSNDEFLIPSRIYFAEEVEIVDGAPVITHYWNYDGERYKSHKGNKAFPEDVYGPVKITRR